MPDWQIKSSLEGLHLFEIPRNLSEDNEMWKSRFKSAHPAAEDTSARQLGGDISR